MHVLTMELGPKLLAVRVNVKTWGKKASAEVARAKG
jgi:hypothetical protein